NVHVYSLGKEKGEKTRFAYSMRLFQYLWNLRGAYDAVFVHMNPEYVVLAGWWWRIAGVRIGLWYTHKNTRLLLRIAAFFSHVIFTASRESFRLQSEKVQVVGHGIDTDLFTPDAHVSRGEHFLSVGRLMKSKRHDLAIQAALEKNREIRIVGEGPERSFLETYARDVGARAIFLGKLTQLELRNEYRSAALLLHTSETGSLDKVVLEALACDCPVKTLDPALKDFESKGSQYVRESHSLFRLIPRIVETLR
ncbi:glycosyltransferase, partial [Candidatus Parcubacteria bacterium]